MNKLVDMQNNFTGVSGPFAAYGSFGVVDGNANAMRKIVETEAGFLFNSCNVTVSCEYTEHENGLVVRKDSLTNHTDTPIVLHKYVSRFFMPFCEAEIYTQYNAWQNESSGEWQKLITSVSAQSTNVRLCEGASPMLAVRNVQNDKTTVFHLLPNSAWKMSARRTPILGKNDNIVIELGLNNDNPLSLTIAPKETIYFPEIIYFDCQRLKDFDAYKLHLFYNKHYPRKNLPIIYNTWFLNFWELDYEQVLEQIRYAKEIGVEYFVCDCGWYSDDHDFFKRVGDWTESANFGFKGKLKQVSDTVRANGMKFGLWFELERAYEGVPAVKDHPEYYFTSEDGEYFLDFSNEDARNYILKVVSELIKKYNIEFIKFDFNKTIAYDPTLQGFYRYHQGYGKFISDLKKAFPDIYLSNCASGGQRLNLETQKLYDSSWFSDNQGQTKGLSIIKNDCLRLPPSHLEHWAAWTFTAPIPHIDHANYHRILLACNNATWDNVRSVTENYTFAFLRGGPVGITCNLALLPESFIASLKKFIASYKTEREFFKNACMYILTDADDLLAIQYSDEKHEKNVLQIFTKNIYQTQYTAYPILDRSKTYTVDGNSPMPADRLLDQGIQLETLKDYDCITVQLDALQS
ncbi:MAG: alpha-galactosidase [Clostridia bacterium]|nr:alpha-galactosidase [Clostridia bacterium]